jgi:hypothetical protein
MKSELLKPILIGIVVAILLTCLLAGLSLFIKGNLVPAGSFRAPVITKLSVPTLTSTSISPIIDLGATQSIQSGEIAVGRYVQITGTGGVGLRFRLSPGINSTPQFIAKENEVFSVIEGPIEKDDITWWLLVASYDKNRQGWAAGQYLTVVTQP